MTADRKRVMHGTGHAMRHLPGPYRGTVRLADGTVWHFFDGYRGVLE